MTTTPPPPPAAPPAPSVQSQPPAKKGMSPWAWVGIGCGCLVLIIAAVVLIGGYFATQKVKGLAEEFEKDPARATAELVVGLNPDLELVDTTEGGKVKVRQKSTGKVATFDLEDIKEGRLSFETDEGRVEFDAEAAAEGGGVLKVTTDEGTSEFGAVSADNVPAWVPVHDDAVEVTGAFHSVTPDGVNGMVGMKVPGSVDDLLDDYEDRLLDEGFEIANETTSRTPKGMVGSLVARDDRGRTVTVAVQPGDDDEHSVVTLNYGERKP